MDIVVFGAGSLGSLVGGLLAREHAVTLVARDPHASAVRDAGLTVGGEFDFRVFPDATTDGTDLHADCAIVTVKAFHTATAAEQLATGDFGTVLSLQNGMGNEELLADHLDCPVLAGAATYGAVLTGPGHVECTGIGNVVLGPRHGGHSNAADWVGEAFSTAGIETTIVRTCPEDCGRNSPSTRESTRPPRSPGSKTARCSGVMPKKSRRRRPVKRRPSPVPKASN